MPSAAPCERSVSPTWLREAARRWRGKGVPGSGALVELQVARLEHEVRAGRRVLADVQVAYDRQRRLLGSGA